MPAAIEKDDKSLQENETADRRGQIKLLTTCIHDRRECGWNRQTEKRV